MNTSQCIRAKFPSVKAYLKSHTLGIRHYDRIWEELTAYGAGREAGSYALLDAHRGLVRVGVVKFWHAIHAALSGQAEWLADWSQAVAYQYWACRVMYAWHLNAWADFASGKFSEQLSTLFLSEYGFSIGNCIALGWFDMAKTQTDDAYSAIDKGFFVDGRSANHCCRVQYFVLRLLRDWQNKSSPIAQGCAYGEPVYDELLKKWRSEEADDVSALLRAACNRHTHVARYDNNREFFELSSDNTWYVPFEVLSVLRLRESLGLSVPALDHPLMNTPLAKLAPASEPYSDVTLLSVLQRIEQKLPQFVA